MSLKPQIVFRTAFDVSKYRSNRRSPVSENLVRVKQYLVGSQTFQEFIPNYQDYEIIVLDNTVESKYDLPRDFLKLWSKSEIICTGTNKYGRFNKGAGDIETLNFAFKNRIITSNFLFYELRMKTAKPDFINSYLSLPRNMITLDSGMQSVKSGYIGFEFGTALNFYKSVSPIRLVLQKKSIEDLLFNYWQIKSLEFFREGNYAFRFDPWENKYIPY